MFCPNNPVSSNVEPHPLLTAAMSCLRNQSLDQGNFVQIFECDDIGCGPFLQALCLSHSQKPMFCPSKPVSCNVEPHPLLTAAVSQKPKSCPGKSCPSCRRRRHSLRTFSASSVSLPIVCPWARLTFMTFLSSIARSTFQVSKWSPPRNNWILVLCLS